MSDVGLALVTPAVREAIARHAAVAFPRECCGLVVRLRGSGMLEYHRADNVAPGTGHDSFVLAPDAWVAAEEDGEIVAIVHSHPNASAHASMADRVMCEQSGLPWLIIGWPSGTMTGLPPTGWTAPLIGREFHHGVLDCYTLIRDYYAQVLQLELPDFERADDWWNQGGNLYRDNFAKAGFAEVAEPQAGDVLLMRVAARVENHAAVFLADGSILHHLYGRLSCRDVWGDVWQRHTTAVLRHQSLLSPLR